MALNKALTLMLVSNKVTALENQVQMSNMMQMSNIMQSQLMAMNSSNMLAMTNLLNADKSSKPNRKSKLNRRKASAKPTMNSNIANLLASLTGEKVRKQRTSCVWVNGLPKDYHNADKLLNIFGNFGNVRKIVFSEKDPNSALIELDNATASTKAVVLMNRQKLDGKAIEVSYARIDHAKMDHAGNEDLLVAKKNWRFTNNIETKYRKLCINTLKKLGSSIVVLNVPEGKSDQLKKHITGSGYTVKSIQCCQRLDAKDKLSTGYTVTFVELASVEETISAVANLHNTWPEEFGAMKKDRHGNARGLTLYLSGVDQVYVKQEKSN